MFCTFDYTHESISIPKILLLKCLMSVLMLAKRTKMTKHEMCCYQLEL